MRKKTKPIYPYTGNAFGGPIVGMANRFEMGGGEDHRDAGMTGMMKAKMAIAAHFGNPTARRMTNYDTRTYTWPGEYEYIDGIGEPKRGNVYVGSYGNLVTPQIQDDGKDLLFVEDVWSTENGPRSYAQSMKFDNEEVARYFAEHYKDVAPMMNLYDKGGSLNQHKTWNNLSIKEKADMMRVAIRNGITNLADIRAKYNEFAEGGNLYDDGGPKTRLMPDGRELTYATVPETNQVRWVDLNDSKDFDGVTGYRWYDENDNMMNYTKYQPGETEVSGESQETEDYQNPLMPLALLKNEMEGMTLQESEDYLKNLRYLQMRNTRGLDSSFGAIHQGPTTWDKDFRNGYQRLAQEPGVADDIDKVMLGTLGLEMIPFAATEAFPALFGLANTASDAAMATSVGQAIGKGVSTYGPAALTSTFGPIGLRNYFSPEGHQKTKGLWNTFWDAPNWYNAVNLGKSFMGDVMDVSMAAPLYKPLTFAAEETGRALRNAGRLFNSPLTGNWTRIGNKEYRLSPNTLGTNGGGIESRTPADEWAEQGAARINAGKSANPPYQIEHYPGYQLRSLMEGNKLEKQLSKNGTISVNSIRAHINKGSNVEKAVVDKVLSSKQFAGRKAIDYNEFRKAVQDELVTFDRVSQSEFADFGMNSLGVSKSDNVSLDTFTLESPKLPKGNAKHYGENTLAHSRTFTTADEPEVRYVMESQSDHGQARYYDEAGKEYTRLEYEETFGKDADFDAARAREKDFLSEEEIDFKDRYSERLIQENLKRAAESGQTKMRYPTRETAAKIEGFEVEELYEFTPEAREQYEAAIKLAREQYKAVKQAAGKQYRAVKFAAGKQYGAIRLPAQEKYDAAVKSAWEQYNAAVDSAQEQYDAVAQSLIERYNAVRQTAQEKYEAAVKLAQEKYDAVVKPAQEKYEAAVKPAQEKYDATIRPAKATMVEILNKYGKPIPKIETILKKYDAFPKQYKKLYKDAEVRTVTDSKGNSWYEVDVPKDYLNQEWRYARDPDSFNAPYKGRYVKDFTDFDTMVDRMNSIVKYEGKNPFKDGIMTGFRKWALDNGAAPKKILEVEKELSSNNWEALKEFTVDARMPSGSAPESGNVTINYYEPEFNQIFPHEVEHRLFRKLFGHKRNSISTDDINAAFKGKGNPMWEAKSNSGDSFYDYYTEDDFEEIVNRFTQIKNALGIKEYRALTEDELKQAYEMVKKGDKRISSNVRLMLENIIDWKAAAKLSGKALGVTGVGYSTLNYLDNGEKVQ